MAVVRAAEKGWPGFRRHPATGPPRRGGCPGSHLPRGHVEGGRTVSLPGFKSFEDLFLGDLHLRCQLGNGRGAAELLAQDGHYLAQPEVQLLHPPGCSDRPALVAEMAFQFSDDRVGGVSRKLDPAVGVETVQRFQQPEGCHLHQVVQRFPPVGETPGQVFGQTEVRGYQLVAQSRVPVAGRTTQIAPVAPGAGSAQGSLPSPENCRPHPPFWAGVSSLKRNAARSHRRLSSARPPRRRG